MADIDALAVALAARYALTPTPAGETAALRSASADPTNELGPDLPLVLVFADAGGYDPGNGTRIGVHTYPVRFYLGEAKVLERDVPRLRRWATVLSDQLRGAAQLGGAATVTSARAIAYRVGLLPYAGRTYAGVEITVEIVTSEAWAATA